MALLLGKHHAMTIQSHKNRNKAESLLLSSSPSSAAGRPRQAACSKFRAGFFALVIMQLTVTFLSILGPSWFSDENKSSSSSIGNHDRHFSTTRTTTSMHSNSLQPKQQQQGENFHSIIVCPIVYTILASIERFPLAVSHAFILQESGAGRHCVKIYYVGSERFQQQLDPLLFRRLDKCGLREEIVEEEGPHKERRTRISQIYKCYFQALVDDYSHSHDSSPKTTTTTNSSSSFSSSYVSILEDDLLPSRDYVAYMHAARRAMELDPTVGCASAWNDNLEGSEQDPEYAQYWPQLDPAVFHLTSQFGGLGFTVSVALLSKVLKTVLNHKPMAATPWDMDVFEYFQQERLSCIYPEIPRTFHLTWVKGRYSGLLHRPTGLVGANNNNNHSKLPDLTWLTNGGYEAHLRHYISTHCHDPTKVRSYPIQHASDKVGWARVKKDFSSLVGMGIGGQMRLHWHGTIWTSPLFGKGRVLIVASYAPVHEEIRNCGHAAKLKPNDSQRQTPPPPGEAATAGLFSSNYKQQASSESSKNHQVVVTNTQRTKEAPPPTSMMMLEEVDPIVVPYPQPAMYKTFSQGGDTAAAAAAGAACWQPNNKEALSSLSSSSSSSSSWAVHWPPTSNNHNKNGGDDFFSFSTTTMVIMANLMDVLAPAAGGVNFQEVAITTTTATTTTEINNDAAAAVTLIFAYLEEQQQECQKDYPFGDNEGYELVVTHNLVQIRCCAMFGCLHAIRVLAQLIIVVVMSDNEDNNPRNNNKAKPPPFRPRHYCLAHSHVEIRDQPLTKYRGLLMDTGRAFFEVDFIKKIIHGISLLRMNALHWHMTDDQSFPIEMVRHPELYQRGANWLGKIHGRCEEPVGRHYTQEDLRELVEYARIRGIRLIPEIDVPAHSRSWGRTNTSSSTSLTVDCPRWVARRTKSAVKGEYVVNVPLDVTDPGTLTVVMDVLDEVASIFPDPWFHAGGDEVPRDCLRENTQVMARANGDIFGAIRAFETSIKTHLETKHNKTKVLFWDDSDQFILGQQQQRRQRRDDDDHTTKYDNDGIVMEVWHREKLREYIQRGIPFIDTGYWYLDVGCKTTSECHRRSPELNMSLGGEACAWELTQGKCQSKENNGQIWERQFDKIVWRKLLGFAEAMWSPPDVTFDLVRSKRAGSWLAEMLDLDLGLVVVE